MAQTPRVWRELDEWMRHRMRAIGLKHLAAWYDHLPRTAGTWGVCEGGATSGEE